MEVSIVLAHREEGVVHRVVEVSSSNVFADNFESSNSDKGTAGDETSSSSLTTRWILSRY